MGCEHCGALRRVEGGVRIGGRVTTLVVFPCPCTEFPRMVEGDPQTLAGIEAPFFGETSAFANWTMRYCGPPVGYTRIRFTNMVCTNYGPGDIVWDAFLIVKALPLETCIVGDSAIWMGAANYFDDDSSDYNCTHITFIAPPVLAVEFTIEAFSTSEFIDNPLFDVTYQIDHTGCP